MTNKKEKLFLIEIHCDNCNKLLGKINGIYEIQCPRCKILNKK